MKNSLLEVIFLTHNKLIHFGQPIEENLCPIKSKVSYFDIPDRYKELSESYPDVIVIKQFGEFFTEIDSVLHS
jgi:hypothetical protein